MLLATLAWSLRICERQATLVTKLDVCPTDDQEVVGSTPTGWQLSSMEIDHEIFSRVILSLPLIQEEQLSVSDERMCTILVNCIDD